MRKTSGRIVRTAAYLVTAAMLAMGASQTQAAVIPALALPGGATNLLAGGWAGGGNGEFNNGYPATSMTDGDLATAVTSTSGSPTKEIHSILFADPTPGITPPTQKTSSGFNLIRLYGQAAYGDTIDNSYVEPPTSVSFKYDMTAGNPLDAYSPQNPNGWANAGTILAVNGVPVVSPTAGNTVALTAGVWGQNGIVPGTAGTHGAANGIYYVDLTVADVPATNSVWFDFGVSPDRTAGNGGLVLNEIQVASVPEPTGLALIALSVGALLIRRRRTA